MRYLVLARQLSAAVTIGPALGDYITLCSTAQIVL